MSQRNADEFFTSNSPWSEMSDRRRFGIPNFVHDISALLVQLIEQKYANFINSSYFLLISILAVSHQCARLLNPSFLNASRSSTIFQHSLRKSLQQKLCSVSRPFPRILKTPPWDATTTISSKRTERGTRASNSTSR